MGGAGAGIVLRAGRLTVQRMSKLLTVRNASYCILGLNCSSEDFAQYRKLDSLVKPTISATAGVPYPARKFDAQKKLAALRVGAWPGTTLPRRRAPPSRWDKYLLMCPSGW